LVRCCCLPALSLALAQQMLKGDVAPACIAAHMADAIPIVVLLSWPPALLSSLNDPS